MLAPALRDELLALASGPDTVAARDRLWAILDDHESWPGRALVGDDGAAAAWLVAQRAIEDVGLQRRCLELLEWAVELGDADPVHLAFLDDRVRMNDGRAQRHGSQFVLDDDGALVPWHLDDPDTVDHRRRRLGLPPLAVHAADMSRRWEEAGHRDDPSDRTDPDRERGERAPPNERAGRGGQPGGGESSTRQQYQAATDR